ncbi:group 3 secretory phospholipase A2-like [Mugil cephalus]|uniref:group 3 secretory phospholipase A2-like n=1 Tax=Mugil cephalus TaxID=48193 RepID=UPI001FB7BCB3|nr:group 3 secretory phospholipase A2-like [Mugil cephalus]
MKTGQPHAEVKSGRLLEVAFLLSSLFLSRAQDAIGPSCLASSPVDGQRRVTFLRQDAAGVRVLYLTLWSEDMRLLTCEVNSSPLVTQTYLSLCERSESWGQEINQGLNISLLLASDNSCVSSTAPKIARRANERDGAAGKTRRKRSWILPGTLWCGSGSKAGGYEQLGMFENADRCCREHDHCQHIIRAFTVNYGVFNPNIFTVSHCECDQRFRQCLLGSNDTISSMVGYSFFNILRVPCFELKQLKRCTEYYWWGMCKAAKEAPYAVFKPPLPYNESDVISKYGHTNQDKLPSSEGQHGVKCPSPQRRSSKTDHRCLLRDPPRGDTFYHRRKKGKGCKRRHKLDATSQIITAPALLNTSQSSLLSNRSRAGKNKSIRKGFLDYTMQNRDDTPRVQTMSDPQTPATTPTTAPSSTQKPKHQLHPTTAVTGVTKSTKSKKNVPKQSRCCGPRMPVGGDTFKAHCKTCQGQETDTNGLSITQTASDLLPIKKMAGTSEQKTLEMLGNMATLPAPVTTKQRSSASLHADGKTDKQAYSRLLWNSAGQEHMGSTIAKNIQAERALKQNRAMHNVTDNQLLCGSLRHLDECELKIPPLEKKYNLHNTESKTAYHCDCTSRLAVQIANFKQPSILSSLLVDFVSEQCFSLSKKKKCHNKKRCSRGFTKASDLHQALKKREEKESAGVRIPGNARKRRIPVSLYKRCLRLGRRADVMEQLG